MQLKTSCVTKYGMPVVLCSPFKLRLFPGMRVEV